MAAAIPSDGFRFVPISQLDPSRIEHFAREVWPGEADRRNVLDSWWMASSADVATVAVEEVTGKIAGLCVGVPSKWEVGGETVSAVSICNWFVAPAFMGKGLGKRLVRSFAERAPYMNAFSVSAAAIDNFRKLGWIGPFRSELLLFPLPFVRGAMRRWRRDVTVEAHRIQALVPEALGAVFDQIDRDRPAGTLRRRRQARDWQRHLSYFPDRPYDIHIVSRGGRPLGYFALRRADRLAGRIYRRARLAYVSDLAINGLDPETVRAMFDAIATAPAVRDAGAILLCTTDALIAGVARDSGWWSGCSPLVGARLRRKAPLYMKGGGFKEGGGDGLDMQLTFFDSDVDLNI